MDDIESDDGDFKGVGDGSTEASLNEETWDKQTLHNRENTDSNLPSLIQKCNT